MRSFRHSITGVTLIGTILLITGCGEDKPVSRQNLPDPVIHMQSHTGCKDIGGHAASGSPVSALDCVYWTYDGTSTLSITRNNVTFNCCVDSLTASLADSDSGITIIETEWATLPCDCLCLYDLQYEIANVPPVKTQLRIVEPYVAPESPQLELIIDLENETSGSLCLDRGYYPWGDE